MTGEDAVERAALVAAVEAAADLDRVDMVAAVLAAVDAYHRDCRNRRRTAGIAKARAEGRYRGRQPTAQEMAPNVLVMHATGVTVSDIVLALGISRASVYRILKGE